MYPNIIFSELMESLVHTNSFWSDHLAVHSSQIISVISLISMQLLMICKDLQK